MIGATMIGAALLLSAAAPGPAAGRPPAAPPAGSGIAWRTDHDQAVSQARKEQRPVLIEFWAGWCKPCHEMDEQLWARPDVPPLTKKFVCLRIDADQQPELARKYDAEVLPTLVLTDPWGAELARREGFAGPDRYLALLRAVPEDFSEIAPLHDQVAAHPRDPQALHDIAMVYQHMKLYDASTHYLEKEIASPEVKANPERLAEALTVIGWNGLREGKPRQARKSFERCLKEVPKHRGVDVTIYGLFASYLMEGDRAKAEPYLGRLEACCPASAFIQRAREDLKAPPARPR
jgi:thioredoxin-like negative regulator of GroEL